jgi:integrase
VYSTPPLHPLLTHTTPTVATYAVAPAARSRAPMAWARIVESQSVDTQHGILSAARGFFSWCVSEHLIKKEPTTGVKVEGRKATGKEQLRLDEARRFIATCLKHSPAPGPTAAVAALLMGARASELVNRKVRDLDNEGSVLWITGELKTKKARRVLKVPELFRPHLLRLAQGKAPTDPLFGDLTRYGLDYWVKAMCREAKVPVVCTHSLRGLHATLAVEAGATPDLVTASLGHESFAISARHYVAAGAIDNAHQAAAVRALTSGNFPVIPTPGP